MKSVVDKPLLDRFRLSRMCHFCGKATPGGCDPHHVFGRGTGGGSRFDVAINLIALCWQCHREDLPGGRITREQILAVVAKREKTTRDEIVRTMNRMRWGRE